NAIAFAFMWSSNRRIVGVRRILCLLLLHRKNGVVVRGVLFSVADQGCAQKSQNLLCTTVGT
ncbi:MAG TPA: hypothetical protein VEV42_04780, partial [Pyrinomonadaceae bacterium]|nr:hypothetical protein [Pyrinomonadaceae bacterium]